MNTNPAHQQYNDNDGGLSGGSINFYATPATSQGMRMNTKSPGRPNVPPGQIQP